MAHEYKDLVGQEIKVGDYVAYAAAWDRSAVLHIGRVRQLTETKEKVYDYHRESSKHHPKVRVRSAEPRRWGEEKWRAQMKDVSLGFFDRLIVLDPRTLPQELLDLLDGFGPIE
jgi:hypothetical protein